MPDEQKENYIGVDYAIDYLNSLVVADPLAIRAVLCARIPCNETLADHPSCIVGGEWPQGFTVEICKPKIPFCEYQAGVAFQG